MTKPAATPREGRTVRTGAPQVAASGTGMSARTAKRIALASYAIVGIVVVVMGTYYAGLWGQSGGGRDGNVRPSNLTGPSEEERLIEYYRNQARGYVNGARQHASLAEKAHKERNVEEFIDNIHRFYRNYWGAKHQYAAASQINLRLGGARFEDGRSQEAEQLRGLSRSIRQFGGWARDLEIEPGQLDDEMASNAKVKFEQLEAEILAEEAQRNPRAAFEALRRSEEENLERHRDALDRIDGETTTSLADDADCRRGAFCNN